MQYLKLFLAFLKVVLFTDLFLQFPLPLTHICMLQVLITFLRDRIFLQLRPTLICFSEFCPILYIVGLLADAGKIALGLNILSKHTNNIISNMEHYLIYFDKHIRTIEGQGYFYSHFGCQSQGSLQIEDKCLKKMDFLNKFILLMNAEMFQRSSNKAFNTPSCQLRSLALPIQGPVLNEYNYIQLRKQSKNRRIDHLIMKELPSLAKSTSVDSSQRDRWQKSLDRYILAKQKLQNRKSNISSEFQFLKLNKINKYRKKKLVEANFLPVSIINTNDLHETYSFDLSETQYGWRHSMKLKNESRRVITEKDGGDVDTPQRNSRVKPMFDREKQQERIMNSLLQNYFKKKYSHNSIKQSVQPRIGKHTSVLIKKNKGKMPL